MLDALGLSSFIQGMQGLSLLPAIFDNLSPRSAAYAETQSSDVNNRLLAVRDQRWKYLRVDPPIQLNSAGSARAETLGWRGRLSGYRQQLANPEMVKKVLRNPMFYVRRQRVDRAPGAPANSTKSANLAPLAARCCSSNWMELISRLSR